MKIDKILIILGEPNSVFSEVLFKYFKNTKLNSIKKNIILIGSYELIIKQMKILNYQFKINLISNIRNSKKNKINMINVNYKFKNAFSQISTKSNSYIVDCFDLALKIIKTNKKITLLNGPISKKHFLNKKYLGVTEYIAKRTKTKKEVMLIYNKNFSVSPVTTHIPLKSVARKINKKKIINTVLKVNEFYKKVIKLKPIIAVLGLNPHCETVSEISEEEKIIVPSIKFLRRKNIKIDGPFAADTFFLKKNIMKYDVAVGMYHDQVLAPIKTLFKFDAINITLGLPFIRISPDHWPNSQMVGKNKSDPSSIYCAMDFLKKI